LIQWWVSEATLTAVSSIGLGPCVWLPGLYLLLLHLHLLLLITSNVWVINENDRVLEGTTIVYVGLQVFVSF